MRTGSRPKIDPELKLNLKELHSLKEDFELPIDPINLKGFRDEVDFNYSIWKKNNVRSHKVSGYSIVTISLTKLGSAPGDATSEQMRICLLYTSPSPRDRTRSRMPSCA